jgi:rubrerythrin
VYNFRGRRTVLIENLTLRKAVELAITTEQIGARFYSSMERKFADDEELRSVFAQLAEDEKTHESQFRGILEQVPEDKPEDRQYELYQFLRATAISGFFRSDSFKDTDEIKDATEALGRALAFEKDTYQYYRAIRDIIGESRQLDEIIKAEKNHVVTLMRIITSEGRFRGLGDKW